MYWQKPSDWSAISSSERTQTWSEYTQMPSRQANSESSLSSRYISQALGWEWMLVFIFSHSHFCLVFSTNKNKSILKLICSCLRRKLIKSPERSVTIWFVENKKKKNPSATRIRKINKWFFFLIDPTWIFFFLF